jgi:hypothetical protein
VPNSLEPFSGTVERRAAYFTVCREAEPSDDARDEQRDEHRETPLERPRLGTHLVGGVARASAGPADPPGHRRHGLADRVLRTTIDRSRREVRHDAAREL